LRWPETLSPDIEGYDVYRSDSENGSYIKVNPTLVYEPVYDGDWYQHYEDKGLINGIAYWYRVTAVATSGVESSPSTAIRGIPEQLAGGDFRIDLVESHQTVSVGDSVTFHLTIVSEDKFDETVTLSATSTDLPLQVIKEFSHADVQPTGSTNLEFIVPYTTDIGEYTIKVNVISASRSHEAIVHLEVVNLGIGESLVTAVVGDDAYRLGERVVIYGQLLPWQPSGTSMSVGIRAPEQSVWSEYPVDINDEGPIDIPMHRQC